MEMVSISSLRHGRGVVTAGLFVACLAGMAGCREETPVTFEPNLVRAHQYQMTEGIDMSLPMQDTQWVLERMFGTPDNPKLPETITEDEELSTIVSMENLQRASGPADAPDRGLYRRHCATCHGITGNGRGRTAALVTPYPRDFRMGIFKFKSTERGAKPLHDDLTRSIRDGIPGTPMAVIPELSREDIDALADYVIYLSMRGELERAMLEDVVLEGLYVPPEDEEEEMLRLISPSLADSPEGSEGRERFDEQMSYIVDHLTNIAGGWLDAEDAVVEVEVPKDIPVPADYAEFHEMMEGEQADELQASVERGQRLFVGKIAACSKCHGEQGRGDGQTNDFDEWTKDWTVRAGLDPANYDQLVPLIARGALPPKNVLPRNFAEGIFRGGSRPEDLYRRIVEGIAGTPMPAATFVEGEYEEHDVWHLINFIRSLDQGPQPTQLQPPDAEQAEPQPNEVADNR